MIPISFPESNRIFAAPNELDEQQCKSIAAYVGEVTVNSCDGARLVVTAWKPDEREIEAIKNGAPIFFSCIGGLPPHFLTTSFEEATHPA